MAKRFTDTEKFKDPWFNSLPMKMKVAWDYICLDCNHAGIWKGDYRTMSLILGAKISEEDCLRFFGEDRFVKLQSGSFYLKKFVSFQYGELNPANKAHKSVLKILEKEGASKPLASPSLGPKDKDKDKDKETDRDKEKEEADDSQRKIDFEIAWARYPLKLDKTEARDRFERIISQPEDFELLLQALDRFKQHHTAQRTEPKFIPRFTTFLGLEKKQRWRDWLDPEAGSSDIPSGNELDPSVFDFLKAEPEVRAVG